MHCAQSSYRRCFAIGDSRWGAVSSALVFALLIGTAARTDGSCGDYVLIGNPLHGMHGKNGPVVPNRAGFADTSLFSAGNLYRTSTATSAILDARASTATKMAATHFTVRWPGTTFHPMPDDALPLVPVPCNGPGCRQAPIESPVVPANPLPTVQEQFALHCQTFCDGADRAPSHPAEPRVHLDRGHPRRIDHPPRLARI